MLTDTDTPTPTPPDDRPVLPRLLTAHEVAEQTGIPLQRVYELCRRDELPHVRLGRSVRFAAPALREWIDDGGTADADDDR